ETERRTWFNWLPVAFGLGIAAYFIADREPLWWGPPLFLAISGALAFTLRTRALAFAMMLAATMIFAGLFGAMLRTERVRAPSIERTTIAKLSGFVETVEERTRDMRLVIVVTSFGALLPGDLPQRVRITAQKGKIISGEHISLTARLMPPPEAARPGGYDFARDAFFRGLGAVGSGLGKFERVPAPSAAPLLVRINATIDVARNAMTERIAMLIGGQAGAVAAALVTGKRGLISEDTNDILRGAGIYHIVSISGLHMVLAAGAIFWMARAIMALVPMMALGWPVKKIAAILAMLGATAYCIFSGSEVATERSLIMTLIMLGAILADRPALSMRNLALAALVVLALEPDALLGPSFQMSFGAVAALIAFAEWQRRRLKPDKAEPGMVGRVIRSVQMGLAGMFITSVLAALATGPFAAFHFQTYNPFGLLGNMLALPFVSLVVMPAAVAGALLYPLGLDAIAWWVMGLATEPVLGVSRFVAGLGGSTQVIPAYSVLAVSAFGLALVLATLFSTWLRVLAILPLAIGVTSAGSPQRADVFIDREAAGVAARSTGGRLAVMGRPGSFVLEQWLKADGDNRKPDDVSVRQGAACDEGGCIVILPGGKSVAWSRDPVSISDDCTRADLVVTPMRWDGACAALMVDRRTLDRFGSISVRSTQQGLVATTSRNPDAPRAWSRKELPRPTTATPTATVPMPDDDLSNAVQD
ncbi:MAG: ComEC/Rec2 family competence protein, partial [Bosea sp. (in: a-proteobacteria)]